MRRPPAPAGGETRGEPVRWRSSGALGIMRSPPAGQRADIMSKSSSFHIDLAAGDAVFREGESGDAMFIIESGSIEIRSSARGYAPIATLGSGDFFGDMSLLEDRPRSADAIALEPARLLRIDRSAFADLLRQNVEIGVRIMRKIAARQRRTEQQLDEALAELERLKAAQGSEVPPPATAPVEEAAVRVSAAHPPAARSFVLRHAGGEEIPLAADRGELLIGRPDPVTGTDPDINLTAHDPTRSLSRRHAKLVLAGDGWVLREEVGTVNGTYVNGERVTTGVDVALQPGDRLRFGAVEIDYAVA